MPDIALAYTGIRQVWVGAEVPAGVDTVADNRQVRLNEPGGCCVGGVGEVVELRGQVDNVVRCVAWDAQPAVLGPAYPTGPGVLGVGQQNELPVPESHRPEITQQTAQYLRAHADPHENDR